MKHTLFALAIASVCGVATAQVTPQPNALIHVDDGTVQVQGGAPVSEGSVGLHPGDVVTIDGEATVTYSNGCTDTVSGQFTTPQTAPACATPPLPIKGDGVWVAAGAVGIVAVGAAIAGGDSDSDTPSSP